MKITHLLPTCGLLLPLLTSAAVAAPPLHPKPAMTNVYKVTPAVPGRVQPFDLADVTLLPSPFQAAMERDTTYLLSLDPDRLLHNFRTEAGLPAKAPIYGGWENSGVAGHILGPCSTGRRITCASRPAWTISSAS